VAEIRTNCGCSACNGRRREPVCTHRGEPALELLETGVAGGAVAKRLQRGEVTAVRVDRSGRPAGRQDEQVALDVGFGDSHGAEPDSAGRRRLLRASLALAAALVAVGVLPGVANASQLLARDTSSERLIVSADGRALVTYYAQGRRWNVLAWGGIGARQPSRDREQVELRIDRSGGWGTFGRPVWKTMRSTCGPYRGPQLPYFVTACTARDGSHWALQRWQRSLANYAIPPWKPGHGAWELRISHWRGEIARFEVWTDWSYSGRWHHLFGRLTYQSQPVHGFSHTPLGEPLDSYGRVLYLDTFDSAYGVGWRRENGFLARDPDGSFCYGFVPHRTHTGEQRPAGNGRRYRLSVSGPGVTPDVTWEGEGLPNFDRANPQHVRLEAEMNALQRQVIWGSESCHA